jgi:hypothetical protein
MLLNASYTTILNTAIADVVSVLTAFAADPLFAEKFALAFGTTISSEQFLQSVAALPQIEVRSDAELNGALGAFSAQTQKIYLSESLLMGDLVRLRSVLIEEIGHFVDAQVNSVDSPGDEGAIFAAVVLGQKLSSSQLAQLKAEDDQAVVMIDGQETAIEMANFAGISFKKFTDVEGDFNLQFQAGSVEIGLRDELLSENSLSFLGGNVSFKPSSSFTYQAPVYNQVEDAYENTAGNHLAKWKIPDNDLESVVSLGVLSFKNDTLKNDAPKWVTGIGAKFSIAINDPIEATWDSNFYIDITNRTEAPPDKPPTPTHETITTSFRLGDPKRHQLDILGNTIGSPVYIDYLGMRPVGSEQAFQYSWDVEDDATIELELFARVYSVSKPIFTNFNNGGS